MLIGEYLNGNRWNGKRYNKNGNKEFEIKEGNGKRKKYDYYSGKIIFEEEYLSEKRNEKGKNIMKMVYYYLMENI